MTGTDVQKFREIVTFLLLPEESSNEPGDATAKLVGCRYCGAVLGSAKVILWLTISIAGSLALASL